VSISASCSTTIKRRSCNCCASLPCIAEQYQHLLQIPRMYKISLTSGFLALLGLWSSTPYGVAAASICNTNSSSPTKTLYVAHQTQGLMTLHFDPSKPSSESLQISNSSTAGFQQGWICGRGDNLYSVSRTHYPTNDSTLGRLFHFKRGASGLLSAIGDTCSHGNGGVYCDIHKDGRILSVANMQVIKHYFTAK
jgi:hypothetical protein